MIKLANLSWNLALKLDKESGKKFWVYERNSYKSIFIPQTIRLSYEEARYSMFKKDGEDKFFHFLRWNSSIDQYGVKNDYVRYEETRDVVFLKHSYKPIYEMQPFSGGTNMAVYFLCTFEGTDYDLGNPKIVETVIIQESDQTIAWKYGESKLKQEYDLILRIDSTMAQKDIKISNNKASLGPNHWWTLAVHGSQNKLLTDGRVHKDVKKYFNNAEAVVGVSYPVETSLKRIRTCVAMDQFTDTSDLYWDAGNKTSQETNNIATIGNSPFDYFLWKRKDRNGIYFKDKGGSSLKEGIFDMSYNESAITEDHQVTNHPLIGSGTIRNFRLRKQSTDSFYDYKNVTDAWVIDKLQINTSSGVIQVKNTTYDSMLELIDVPKTEATPTPEKEKTNYIKV